MELIRVKKLRLSLDMAPLIDIVFQLLIFFMLTASFAYHPFLKVNLPKATTKDQPQKEEIVVQVDKEGRISLNDQTVSLDRLKADLAQLLKSKVQKIVFIQGDADMAYKYFVSVMDAARQAGASQVNIVHREKD